MRAPLRPALLLLALGACETPPPEAYVPGGSAPTAAAAFAIGQNARGEDCRMLRSGGGAEVYCGAWESPSARIREVPAAPVPALAAQAAAALDSRLACEAPRATAVLGGQPAALLECRRRVGGWPAFALVATAGGRGFQAEGVLPALPAAERAIGILAGLAQPEGALPPSAALDMMAARLARDSFGAGDIASFEQLMTIGRDANQAERFVAAETAYRGALTAQERLLGVGAPDTFAPMMRLALQLSNQGRFPEAEQLLDRAAPLAARATDPLARAQIEHYRGLHEANRGRADRGLAAFARAEALYGRDLPPGLGVPGGRAAEAGGAAFDPLAARAIVGTVEVRRNRAALLRSAGRTGEAQAAARQAEALAASAPGALGADLIAARLARTSGGAAEGAGAPRRAAGDFARAADRFARGVPRSRPFADTLLLQAEASAEAGAGRAAILGICRQAVAVLRELREGTSARAVAPCVDAFAGSADGSQALLAEAFEAAQLAQGDVTAVQIARAAARLTESRSNPAAAEAIRARETARQRLAGLYRARDEASAAAGRGAGPDVAALDTEIAEAQEAQLDADQAAQAAAPGFAQLLQSVAPAAEVLAALAPGEALASIFLPPTAQGWTFVLQDGAIAAGRIGARGTEVEALSRRLRASLEDGNGDKPFDADAAHRLHQALFGNVVAPLAAAQRLVVVPAGQLLSLPFGVLVEAPPPAPTGHEGLSFLLARLPVAHVPAPSSLVALRRAGESRATQPWFGFGAPVPVPAAQAARTFASAECGRLLAALPPLATAGIELQASAQLMGASQQDKRLGAAFTAATVQRTALRDVRVLHFATHGLLPGELSCLQDAAIVASAAPGARDARGALLTAGTVLDLELDADAVVLSACNSGVGEGSGESLSGLARAFFYAGARSLMVTHWYVNDAAATRIVAYTLRNRQQGQGMAEALRAAQLDLARNVPGASHPALWGAFGLVGPGPGAARGPG